MQGKERCPSQMVWAASVSRNCCISNDWKILQLCAVTAPAASSLTYKNRGIHSKKLPLWMIAWVHKPCSHLNLIFSSKPSFKLQHTCVLRLLANTWHGFSLQHQPGFSCTCWGGPQWLNCWACKSQRGLPLDPRGLLPEPGIAPGSETSQHVPIVGRPWKGYGYFVR